MSGWFRGSRTGGSALSVLAELLCAALIFASLAPSAVRAEGESEGEGAGPPVPPPIGLEEGGELGGGGEETELEEMAPETGEEADEEVVPIGPGEPAPPPEVPVALPTPPVEEETQAPAPEAAPPPVVEVPAPGYEVQPAASEYETGPGPDGVVENQTLVAPPTSEGKTHRRSHKASAAGPEAEGGTVAAAESGAPPDEREPPVAEPTPATAAERPHSLAGSPSHTVRAGECLWSIAEAVLPPGASDARVATEVARLWRVNAARIGTGDPNLIMAGTVLRLH